MNAQTYFTFVTRKGCFKLALATLALGLVAIAILAGREENVPQRLPDGSVVTLVEAEFGRTNLSVDANFLARVRRQLLPASGLKLMGRQWVKPLATGVLLKQFHNFESPYARDGTLVFVLRHSGTVPIRSAMGILPDAWLGPVRAVAFDDLGNEMEVYLAGTALYQREAAATNAITYWPIQAFPRGGKTVGLRLLQKAETNGWRSVAEFTLPNPAPTVPKVIEPMPMPVRRMEGDLEFSLMKFEVGESSNGLAQAYARRNARATVRVSQNGQPTDLYALRKVVMADASGNEYRCTLSRRETNGVYNLEGLLDPHQPWIVKMEFGRTRDFPPEALVLVEVPPQFIAQGGRRDLYRTNAHGHRIMVWMAGSQIDITFPEATNGCFATLVKATASDGSLLPTSNFSAAYPMAGTDLPAVQKAGKATLTFAIEKGIAVEYVVRPKIIEVTKDSLTLPER